MRKKLPTQRSTRTPIPKNPPSSKGPQTHIHIHIHSHSSSSPSSHSTASMARKIIHAKGSTRKEDGSSQKKVSKGKGPMPKEDDDSPSSPSRRSPPPRRSTPHPTGRSAPSQRPKRTVLHDTREPPNLDSLDFKNKYSKIHSHYDPYHFISCAAYEFHSQVLVCENFSSLDGTTLTYKALGPVRVLLHRIINHVIMPQSGSYQRVTICDTLVLFVILSSAPISFAYLMIRHMWDCIRSDKKCNLPYGIFLTCIFKYFQVDLSNEPVENRFLLSKVGEFPSRLKEKKAKSSKALVFTNSEDESFSPAEISDKSRFSETVKDVLTKFSNMSNLMVKSYKEARKQALRMKKFGQSAMKG
ncbi:uncharacterized protein DS421_18g615410 [Arachis hypogaea]|nr:uncharacterized protein DS421_18g615410 [Arachis hypogaea]